MSNVTGGSDVAFIHVDVITRWWRWMKAGGTPSTTRNLRRYYLRRLERERGDVLALVVDDLAEWLGSQGWSPNTLKSARSSLRSFYGWAQAAGLLTVSPAHLLPAVRVPRGRPKPTPETAYRQALTAADERVRIAVQLAGRCGLRRGEIAKVHRVDLEADLAGWSLRVKGKGGHVRMVPLPDDLAERLLEVVGYAFPSPLGGHLTPGHVAKLVGRALPDGVSMHSLRHRCATTAYAATRDLRAVQELLGHSRPETTAAYVLAPDESIRAAMLAAAA